MAEELMLAVASALAGKAAEAAFQGARGAWGALVRLVRERFACDDRDAVAALEAVRERPRDEAVVRELAAALSRIAGVDTGFAAELRALWPQARVELSATGGGVANSSSGTVGGHLVQARDLHVQGGLHLGDVQGQPGS